MSQKISFPAAERNGSYILEVIEKYVDPTKYGDVIEIGSGTGQHITYFAEHLPNLTFQPSEYDLSLFNSIKAYVEDAPTKNVKKPIYIDISTEHKTWNMEHKYDYMLNINMVHITPFKCTEGLFQNAPKILKPDGFLIMYGPYAYDGLITPQSNLDFHNMLQDRNHEWGLRDVKVLENLAELNGLKFLKMFELPANNKCLVWQNTNIQ